MLISTPQGHTICFEGQEHTCIRYCGEVRQQGVRHNLFARSLVCRRFQPDKVEGEGSASILALLFQV